MLFQQLGMEIHPDVLAAAAGGPRVELSFEQVDMLQADLLVVHTGGGDPSDVPGYDALPAVSAGAVSELGFAEVVGLNTPTPLSIPFALDLLRPALEAVA